MSDHPKEAERNLKRIRVCDDIYLDVFRLLAPAKVGLELALVSDRFDALVDTHFKSRKWTIGKLTINSKDIVKTNDDGTEKTLPFPPKPLPNSIVGFARVVFRSLNVTSFLRCIGRLLESNICLKFDICWKYDWEVFTIFVWPLLNVSAIIKMHFEYPSNFKNFRLFTSPTILRDCSNLRMITFGYCQSIQFLQFPPDDSMGSSAGQAMCKWLLMPRADGQPKVFGCGRPFPMDALKTSFLSATTTVGFIIRLRSDTTVGPFELVNSLTREQLTSRKINDDDDDLWLIERSPIDKNVEQWAKWEKEAMDDGENDWKVVRILLH